MELPHEKFIGRVAETIAGRPVDASGRTLWNWRSHHSSKLKFMGCVSSFGPIAGSSGGGHGGRPRGTFPGGSRKPLPGGQWTRPGGRSGIGAVIIRRNCSSWVACPRSARLRDRPAGAMEAVLAEPSRADQGTAEMERKCLLEIRLGLAGDIGISPRGPAGESCRRSRAPMGECKCMPGERAGIAGFLLGADPSSHCCDCWNS